MNEATKLDVKRLPVISLSLLFKQKSMPGTREAGGQMINLEKHLPTPAVRFHRSKVDKCGESPLFLGTWAL